MTKQTAETRPIPRRGLSRVEAAMYIGVSASKFDELRVAGKVPGPRKIGDRKVWDVRELDLAFESFPAEDAPSQEWAV